MFSAISNLFPRRFSLVITFATRNMLLPLAHMLLSYLLIQFVNQALWGAFVIPMISIQFAGHILAWGSHNFLLRRFSQQPAALRQDWQNSLLTRATGLLPAMAILMYLLPSTIGRGWVLLWLLSIFFSQSLEVLALYTKRIWPLIGGELLSLAWVLLAWYLDPEPITLSKLVAYYTGGKAIQAAWLLWHFQGMIWPTFQPRWKQLHIGAATPFFLAGLSGLLNSRIDLYQVSYWMSEESVTVYQVMISLFMYLQAVSGWVTLPFAKQLYRLDDRALISLAPKLLGLGVGVCVLGLPLCAGVLAMYGFAIPWSYFAWASLLIIPIYGYLPFIYWANKYHHDRSVLVITLLGISLNVGINLLLIEPLGIEGALIASALAQVGQGITFALYYVSQSRSAFS